MTSDCHSRELRGHSWLLGEIVILIHVFCMSLKEAKRTFLAPALRGDPGKQTLGSQGFWGLVSPQVTNVTVGYHT
jgi:hypothetical protein